MPPTTLAHLAAALAALSAGGAVVATRLVIAETDPMALVLYRYTISVACLAPFLPALWPRGIGWAGYARIALLGVLFFILFPWGFNASLQHVPAARGAIGLATIPVQTMLVAAAFRRERLTATKATGVMLAFAGIGLAFGPAAFDRDMAATLTGDTLMLLGVLCASVYSVFSRGTLMRHGPLFVTALAMGFAVAILLPVVVVRDGGLRLPALDANGWIAIAFLGTIAGAVQFSLFMWALRWLSPTTTVLYLTLNPLTAMVLGAILLGETLTLGLFGGMALVLCGVLVGGGAIPLRRGSA